MKIKTILTITLLLFIFGSTAYLIIGELRPATKPAEQKTLLPSPLPTASKVVVYYFHTTARCQTCRKFESYSDETIRQTFAKELNDGRLEWKVVNVDEPANKHFVGDYQLYSKSIVIVKIRDGKQTAWKNLDKIWELVRDKNAFVKYIQDEVKSCVEAK